MTTTTTTTDDTVTSLLPLSVNDKNENDDQKKIDLAIRFWKHPQLRHTMTVDQQRHYLQHQKGVTDNQLYKAWDQMLLLDQQQQQQQQQAFSNSGHNRTSATMSPAGPPQKNPRSFVENQSYPQPPSSYKNHQPHHSSLSYPHNDDDSLVDPLTVVQGTSLMALGGLIGLSAAAAVRWLNGGDFHLFSPTKSASHPAHNHDDDDCQHAVDRSTTHTEEGLTSELAEYTLLDSIMRHEEEDDDDCVAEQLLQSMETLSQQVHSQGTVQQQILQKLGPSSNQAITDSSMDWLRKSSTTTTTTTTNKEDSNNKEKENANKQQELLLQEIGNELMEIKKQLITTVTDVSTPPPHQQDERTSQSMNNNTKEGNGGKDSGMKKSGGGDGDRTTAMARSNTTTTQALVTRIETCIAKVNEIATISTTTVQALTPSTGSSVPVDEGRTDITSITMPSQTTTASSSVPSIVTSSSEENKSTNNIHDALADSITLTQTRKDNQDDKDGDHVAVMQDTVATTSPTTDSTTDTADEEIEASSARPVTAAAIKLTLRQAIRKIATENDATSIRIGTHLLYLFVVNLSGKPNMARHRKIFTCNDSFQKVEQLKGGIDLLMSVGFEREEEKDEPSSNQNHLEWLPNGTPDDEVLCLERLKEAASALGLLKSGKPSSDLTERALAFLAPDPDVEFSKR